VDARSRIIQDLRASGLPLDTVTYNAVLAACEVGRDWQRALHLYGEMKSARAARVEVSLFLPRPSASGAQEEP
jgi:pentatricopeptide repeat protein